MQQDILTCLLALGWSSQYYSVYKTGVLLLILCF